MLNRRLFLFSVLLLLSGLCALVYQTVWLRTFRLIFGASTPATAAVLAIFMGGLGLGALKLGREAEASENPLRLYARLELGIAFTAAVSPVLLDLVRGVYLALGGSTSMGGFGATVVRLLLAPLVIGVPVFFMGGTLPAAARAITTSQDVGRRGLAVLYGVNAIGAVAGVVLATFFLFESLGHQATLWLACGLNGLVGAVAYLASRGERAPPARIQPAAQPAPAGGQPKVPRRWILLAAFATGFSFLLAELVWFRLSAPILGGTTYSFGLILAYALAGIGAGGLLYGWWGRPTPGLFALTCALEALALLFPYVLGDDLAWLTLYLRRFSAHGFGALVATWALVAGVLVLPPALVAGFQFPLLLGLKGEGPEGVAVDVGEVYAANTLGAISGSLAGGFGLLPLLTAPGAWKLSAVLLLPVALPFARRGRVRWAFAALCLTVGACLLADGPGAFWRHTGVGAGRNKAVNRTTWNQLRDFDAEIGRNLYADYEGRESSIGVLKGDGLVFFTNGKSDGHIVKDAPTTVYLGLIGAILHPNPRRAFVIGLGGGQTAGWLAEVPGMQRVDVAELEPAVLEFARAASPYNFDVMNHPRVNVQVADAREVLQTTPARYDLIASEPSNPYRAGVASLFSLEFYQEAKRRLNDGGFYLQWLQLYDVDPVTLRICLATLREAFAKVTVWLLNAGGDLLLIGCDRPQVYDVSLLRERLSGEPYRSAFGRIGGIYDVEGFLATFVAGDPLAERALQTSGDELNTDDHLRLEYRFARLVGSQRGITPFHLLGPAKRLNATRPLVMGELDWDRVSALRTRSFQVAGLPMPALRVGKNLADQARFWLAMQDSRFDEAASLVASLAPPPEVDLYERLQRARALAWSPGHRHPDPAGFDAELQALSAGGLGTEVAWLRVRAALVRPQAHGRLPELVEDACRRTRQDPMVSFVHLISLLKALPAQIQDPEVARPVARSLAKAPFAVFIEDERRRVAAMNLAAKGEDFELVAQLFEAIEPHPYWRENALRLRAKAYEDTSHPLAKRAKRDLERFLRERGATVDDAFRER